MRLQYDYLPYCPLKLQAWLGEHTYTTENHSLRISQIPDETLDFSSFLYIYVNI